MKKRLEPRLQDKLDPRCDHTLKTRSRSLSRIASVCSQHPSNLPLKKQSSFKMNRMRMTTTMQNFKTHRISLPTRASKSSSEFSSSNLKSISFRVHCLGVTRRVESQISF